MNVTGRICFAAYEGFTGCVQSCRHAAEVLEGTWTIVPRSGDPPPAAIEAHLLVLSSWHDRYEPLLARRARPTVARWHSPLLQTDLADEREKLAGILDRLDSGALAAVAASDLDLVRALDRGGVIHAPEVFSTSECDGVVPAPLRGVHVSLFGLAEPRKNLIVQSAAFAKARRLAGDDTWMLHLNGQSLAGWGYDRWLASARIPFVDHGWLGRREHLSLVAAMAAGLCASLSESYCYAAAEHVAMGVPVVASDAVACLGDWGPRVRPDRVEDIATALVLAVRSRAEVGASQRRALMDQALVNSGLAQAAFARIPQGS